MNIIVQNLMTNYDRQGEGLPIVLVHGWGDSLKTFDELAKLLAQTNDVIRLDLPGFGTTEAPKTVWNLDNYAQFLADFLTKLGVNEYVLAGHSNGGAVAIRGTGIGILQPHKLILLAASGIRTGGGVRRAALKTIAKVGKVVTFWLPRAKKRALQEKLYGAAGSDMLVAPHLKETFRLTVRQDIQQDAKKISVPTVLIYGENDRATPISEVAQPFMACIAGSTLTIIPGADHFVHHPASNVLPKIQEFLA